jgi:molecular chaperone GrpE
MPQDKIGRGLPPDADNTEDIEILEVVGVDEDGTPIETVDPDDIEVVFDDAPGDADDAPAAPSGVTIEEIQLRDRLMRLQADFENFKKRIDRERIDHFRYATAELVVRILPVLDNFERAMAAARPGTSADALLEGLVLVKRQLVAELEVEGLRPMDSVGEAFNPERHEAVATDPDSPMPPHTVTQEFARGYFFHDRVLRPAMVRVSVDPADGGAIPDDGKES